MKRREFIKIAAGALLIGNSGAMGASDRVTYEEFLKEGVVSRGVIDRFLSGPAWARFASELGYRGKVGLYYFPLVPSS